MPFCTKLTERLGIKHPILLAPMGLISGGALARTVTEAGGLGPIGLGYGDQEWLDREFLAFGNAKTGCGFITWSLDLQPHLLDRALGHRPAAVMLSFGDPQPYAATIKDTGASLICQVQSVSEAERAIESGADIIVAQGTEAGGHGSTRSTLPLVPAVVDVAQLAPVPSRLYAPPPRLRRERNSRRKRRRNIGGAGIAVRYKLHNLSPRETP